MARNGKPDTPHRHNYYTVLLVKKAKGKHIIDFKEYALIGNQVFFVGPEQVHQIVECNDFELLLPKRGPKKAAPNSSKTIDTDTYSHSITPTEVVLNA